jgi:hypothetical protein
MWSAIIDPFPGLLHNPPPPEQRPFMKSSKTFRSRAAHPRARILIRALLLGFFALNRQTRAQYVLAPAPSAPDPTPPAVQQVSEMDVFASPAPQTSSQPFKWGALTLRPHLYYQFLYADGLLISTNQAVSSTIQTISPGALLEIGRHWTLDYSPAFTLYSDQRLSDAFGQAAKLTGGTVYNDWLLGLSLNYASVDTLSAVTASQTRTETFATALNGSYTINSKMSLDLALNQSFVSADHFSSYNEWSTLDWLNYQFWPRLNVALGVGGGYDDNRTGPDTSFEQFQGRVNWRATDRISFQINGGVEVRQFLNGSTNGVAKPLVNPVFGATIQYRPFEMTQISLAGQRVVSTSYLDNRVTETTGVNAGLNQQLPGKFFLDLGGGYQAVKYVSSGSAAGSDRSDNYFIFNAQLGRVFLKRGNVAVIYQLNRNDSSESGYSFTSHQVGFQIRYSF